MKIILTIVLAISLSSCENRTEKLIKKGYGEDLSKFIDKNNSKVEDGLIVIKNLNQNSKELTILVDVKEIPRQRTFYWEKKKISKDSWGKSICKNWGDFGGLTQYAIYYPEVDILMLGFFSGMDE